MLGVSIIYQSTFFYFIYQQIFRPDPSRHLFIVVIRSILGVLNWFGFVMYLMTTLYGDGAAIGWNQLHKIERDLKDWAEGCG